jgi:phosphoribosyl-ATP pyrophosphohydrolase/phosphoribosyl-AMP cyclohydrolase/histidinol dehydrogenase
MKKSGRCIEEVARRKVEIPHVFTRRTTRLLKLTHGPELKYIFYAKPDLGYKIILPLHPFIGPQNLDSLPLFTSTQFKMDTTLPLPFLPSVDLSKGPVESKEGLTRNQLSYLGCVYFFATNETVDTLLQFLQRHIATEGYVNVTSIDSTDDLVSILDAGARKVFVNASQFESLKTYGDRVIPVISTQDDTSSTSKFPNGVLFETGDDLSTYKPLLASLTASKTSPVFVVSSSKTSLQPFVQFATEASAVPIIPATQLTIGEGSAVQTSISSLIGSSWTSDRTDKLIPTVVTDERGIALGLVYSSQESVAESLKTGTGVYQSRKRGLWYKGATSGDTQELVRISLDCDQDCLKFVVRQKGRGE